MSTITKNLNFAAFLPVLCVKWDVALRRLSHQPEAMQALHKKYIKNKN